MYIVVVGNPGCSLIYYGPFESYDHALRFGTNNPVADFSGVPWIIAALEKTTDY